MVDIHHSRFDESEQQAWCSEAQAFKEGMAAERWEDILHVVNVFEPVQPEWLVVSIPKSKYDNQSQINLNPECIAGPMGVVQLK